MRGLRWLALVVLLAAPLARAQDPVVVVGVRLYRSGDFSGAVLALNQALDSGLRDPLDRATAALALAASYDALGQRGYARQVLEQLFHEQPAAVIDPQLFPPDFIHFAEAVRRAVTGAGPPLSPPVPPAALPPAPPAPPGVYGYLPWRGPHGFQLGLRMAYAIPFGEEVGGLKLSDDVSGALPFELDLGWRITPRWYLGMWFAGGPAFAHGSCSPGCSNEVVSSGLEGELHFNPLHFDPWIGLGFGWEYLHSHFVSGGYVYPSTLSGWTYVRGAVGIDFRLSPLVTIGPYVSDALGEYFNVSYDGYYANVGDRGLHSFLAFGARTTLNFE